MLDKLNPMMSSGKKFVARVNNIEDASILKEALKKWQGQFSRNQQLVIQRRLNELEPKPRQPRLTHHTHRKDIY